MLRQLFPSLKTGSLGFLSGGVAVLLGSALSSLIHSEMSESQVLSAQAEVPTTTARVVACVYSSPLMNSDCGNADHNAEAQTVDSIYADAPSCDKSCSALFSTESGTEPSANPVVSCQDGACNKALCATHVSDVEAEFQEDDLVAAAVDRGVYQDAASVAECDTTIDVGQVTDFERVCALRDNEGTSVATLRMAGSIVSAPLSAGEEKCIDGMRADCACRADSETCDIATRTPMVRRLASLVSAARESEPKQPPAASCSAAKVRTVTGGLSRHSEVSIDFDRERQLVVIHAEDVCLRDVLNRVSREIQQPIPFASNCDSTLETMAIDATVTGATLIHALETLLIERNLLLHDDGSKYQVRLQDTCEDSAPAGETRVKLVTFEDHGSVQELLRAEVEKKDDSQWLPEPWKIVESSTASCDKDELSMPPGMVPLSVDTAELEVARQARKLIADGSLNATIDLLTQAVAEYTESAMLFRMLGEAYMWRDDYEAASRALEHSLSLNKMDPVTNNLFAESLMKLGQESRAHHYRQQAMDAQRMGESEPHSLAD